MSNYSSMSLRGVKLFKHEPLRWWLAVLLIFTSAASASTEQRRRQLLEPYEGDSSSSDSFVADKASGRKPFMAVKDTVGATSAQAQRLYEQAGSASAIAYLLFGAAEPLSKVPGGTTALLPYLTPTILRLYFSQPSRCATRLAAELYDLSYDLYGNGQLKGAHYAVYRALQDTFTWVGDVVPLAVQHVPGQDTADAMFPSLPPPELVAALQTALADPAVLGEAGDVLEAAAGLDRNAFAVLVPRIAEDLAALHADLPALQNVALALHAQHWDPEEEGEGPAPGAEDKSAAQRKARQDKGVGSGAEGAEEGEGDLGGRRRQAMQRGRGRVARVARQRAALEAGLEMGGGLSAAFQRGGDMGENETRDEAGASAQPQRSRDVGEEPLAGDGSEASLQRRRLLVLPSNYNFSRPPSTFSPAAAAAMPKVLLPLVFHILLYTDSAGVTGPANYQQAAAYAERMVRVTNAMSKPMNFQFYIKEVRSDPVKYPYLLLSSRNAWLTCPNGGASGTACLLSDTFVSNNVVNFPQFINIFIASDSSAVEDVPLGYGFVPGSDTAPLNGHIFVTWDSLSADGFNSLTHYNDGPNTLLHELYHHLGLLHPFGPTNDAGNTCNDDDYVIDTPTTLGSASSSSFVSTSTSYCMELFWGGYGGDWSATYTRWSTTLGVPEGDMNAWADSCPNLVGYDELGNYMTYNTAVCFAGLGHFTPGQAQRAHLITSELNPTLYAWGQYFASVNTTAQPMPVAEAYENICRSTSSGFCACKASWTKNSVAYSYCDRTGTSNALECEVADPASCAACPATGPCILSCTGTARQCRKALAPGTNTPPPPPPRASSPPPLPPPPPPRAVPEACKTSNSGCACRRTWNYAGIYSSYCASPDADPQLWCEITPDCATYDIANPYEYCARNLTVAVCGGPVVFSTSSSGPTGPSPPPAPLSPPPASSPRAAPPTPSYAATAVASFSGTLRLNASCDLIPVNGSQLIVDLVAELAATYKVPSAGVTVGNLTCGSIIAPYTISFPPGTTVEEIISAQGKAAVATATGLISANFSAKWGPAVGASASDVTVLQQAEVCPPGSPVSALCPAGSPPPPAAAAPPPPAEESKSFPMAIVIGAAVGGGVALIVLLVVVIVLVTRKPQGPAPHVGKAQVAPYPPSGAAPGPPAFPAAAPYASTPPPAYQPPPGGPVRDPAGLPGGPAAQFRPSGGYDAPAAGVYPPLPPQQQYGGYPQQQQQQPYPY